MISFPIMDLLGSLSVHWNHCSCRVRWALSGKSLPRLAGRPPESPLEAVATVPGRVEGCVPQWEERRELILSLQRLPWRRPHPCIPVGELVTFSCCSLWPSPAARGKGGAKGFRHNCLGRGGGVPPSCSLFSSSFGLHQGIASPWESCGFHNSALKPERPVASGWATEMLRPDG